MGYIIVDVTQDDIDRGIQNNSSKCVAAQAVARTIKGATRIAVDSQTVRFTDARGVRRIYLSPPAVERYVIAFDAGDTIDPFRFRLDDRLRVDAPRRKYTDAGKAVRRTKDASRRADRKLAKLETDPAATPAEITVARENVERKHAAAAQAAADTAGAVQQNIVRPPAEPDIPVRRTPARQVSRETRHYGHRTMRINQQ